MFRCVFIAMYGVKELRKLITYVLNHFETVFFVENVKI